MSLIQLEFLTDDQNVIKLCQEYWEIKPDLQFTFKTTDIAKAFGVKTSRLSAMLAKYCRASSAEDVCLRCGNLYYYSSRTDFASRHTHRKRGWTCDDCRRREFEQIEIERAKHEAQRSEKLRLLLANAARQPIAVMDIAFDDAVFLLSIFRLGVTENLDYIRSLSSFGIGSLSPRPDFDTEIFRQLYSHNLLSIHEDSPVTAFNEDFTKFDLRQVFWMPPILTEDKASNVFFVELESIFRNHEWPEHWNSAWRSLWKKIALEECLQYLEYSLAEHGLTLTPGEKTLHVFNYVLELFSVSQVFSFIWRASKDAAAFYVREGVPKQHAANTIVGSIQRQVDRAKSEGWTIKGFQRNYQLPQSMVSRIFSDVAMQFGDDGFTVTPSVASNIQGDDLDTQFENM